MITISFLGVTVSPISNGYAITGVVSVIEDGLNHAVSGTIETNGNATISIPESGSTPFRFTALGGPQLITVTARNSRYPVPDSVVERYQVDVPYPSGFESSSRSGVLYGPVLPLSELGSSTWNLEKGYDVEVIKSSVKMLLITGRGERLMDPEYGTMLSKIVFSSPHDDMDSIAMNEITTALQQYEPRARVTSVQVGSPVNGRVSVKATFSTTFGNMFDLTFGISQ